MRLSEKQIFESLSPFSEYIDEIGSFLRALNSSNSYPKSISEIAVLLNGKASSELNRSVPTKLRKETGIFFTGAALSERVATKISPLIRSGLKISDPACGAGDLLLACAKYLPRGRDFLETIEIWSKKLFGNDIHYHLIRAAKLRVALLAASYHLAKDESVLFNETEIDFKGIRVSDTLANPKPIEEVDCVVVNPPFGHSSAPDSCEWASGKVQIAGLFLEHLLRSASKGQHIVAILPDVLRSGTRYEKWREMVLRHSQSLDVEIFGRFDHVTDVDVFILHLVVEEPKTKKIKWPSTFASTEKANLIISDLFDVSVGAVVPYRAPKKGNWYPYLDCSNALPWRVVENLSKRRFNGTTFMPPFVVVRRTSNPSDNNRAVSTIVKGLSPIAVENHLIVIKPKDGSFQKCKKLLLNLGNEKTQQWLNSRIRCRHLTLSSIKELPWWETD